MGSGAGPAIRHAIFRPTPRGARPRDGRSLEQAAATLARVSSVDALLRDSSPTTVPLTQHRHPLDHLTSARTLDGRAVPSGLRAHRGFWGAARRTSGGVMPAAHGSIEVRWPGRSLCPGHRRPREQAQHGEPSPVWCQPPEVERPQGRRARAGGLVGSGGGAGHGTSKLARGWYIGGSGRAPPVRHTVSHNAARRPTTQVEGRLEHGVRLTGWGLSDGGVRGGSRPAAPGGREAALGAAPKCSHPPRSRSHHPTPTAG